MRAGLRVIVTCVVLASGALPDASTVVRASQQPPADVRATGDAALSGVVVDADTGQPVPGALVTLVRAPREPVGRQNRQLADAQGRFVFVDLPAGDGYGLVGSKAGYLTTIADARPISLADGEWIDNARLHLRRAGAITGVVTDERGEPVAGVEVRALAVLSIAGTDQIAVGPTTTTDDRGRYRIGNLLPGRYSVVVPSLQASVSQWSTPEPPGGGRPRVPGAGLMPGSDDSVIPILDLPGSVRVALGRHPIPPPPDADGQAFAYPPTFHPGTPRLDAASIVEIESGSDVTADVRIQAMPASVIRGIVEGPGQVANLLVRLVSFPDLGLGLETGTARTDASGAFTFVNVPAGDYVIDVPISVNEYEYRAADGPRLPLRPPPTFGPMSSRSWQAGGIPGASLVSRSSGATTFVSSQGITTETDNSSALWARESFTVAPGNPTNVILRLRSSGRITGRLAFEGNIDELDPSALRTLLLADPVDGSSRLGLPMATIARDDPSRSFAITGVLPGAYFLRQGMPGLWTIKSVQHNGREHLDVPIDISDGRSIDDVVVTLTTEGATIAGSVVPARGGEPVTGDEVVVFPADARFWSSFGVKAPRMRAVPLAPDGRFSASGLPAGEYLVTTIRSAETATWRRPGELSRLAASSEHVTVDWGATANVTLRGR